MIDANFMGKDGFYWFVGVVEDRQDPLKLGRVRVRILGSHTKDKQLIPTEDLPWSNVMQPITSAAMNGMGDTPLGPVPGTWCVGFWRDGDSCQDACIIGTMAGIPEEKADKTTGFYDPRDNEKLDEKLENAPRRIKVREYHNDGSGITRTNEDAAQPYPREVNYYGCQIGEPDTNRLARNEGDTVIDLRNLTLDGNVPIAFGGIWDEPESSYEAEYPYNHVTESESGHIVEVDDTPGHERTHFWDRSGNFEENQADGTKITKATGHAFRIFMRDDKVHIMGENDVTCDKDHNLFVKGSWNIEVLGNANIFVHGGAYIKTGGELDATVGGNLVASAAGKIDLQAVSDINIKAGGNVNIDGAAVYLNSGRATPSTPRSPKQ